MQYMKVVLGILIFIFCFLDNVLTQRHGPYSMHFNPFKMGLGGPGIFNFPSDDSPQSYSSSHDVFEVLEPGQFISSNKEKLTRLGATLKSQVAELRETPSHQLELVFLVDSSTSVGATDFTNELKFVKKLLADFTVDRHSTRVAVVTYSSESRVVRHIDQLDPGANSEHHKCSLLQDDMPRIGYFGGGTYTLGAFLEAKVSMHIGLQNSLSGRP